MATTVKKNGDGAVVGEIVEGGKKRSYRNVSSVFGVIQNQGGRKPG